jgi:ABC-type nitrate/sulfonate/bicarbonate transport system substrate-binding protein
MVAHPPLEITHLASFGGLGTRVSRLHRQDLPVRRRPLLSFIAVLAGLVLAPAVGRAQVPAATHVVVLVPDGDNLQYLPFWVAKGAGYFADEGVVPELLVPEEPAQAIARMIAGDAPVAVLPPPVYLQLVADRFPIVLVANLLQNDPINLVVRRSVFAERGMSRSAPLRDRLLSLRGLRIGVAPGPPTRLRMLFSSVGLDADRDVKIVTRRGPVQNEAFGDEECDALYAHTPYLEKALDDQDAVMLVDQSSGEIPSLSMHQIHALVVRRDYLEAHRAIVASMVRALGRAEALVHADAAATEDAVLRALPGLERRHVHTIVGIYQPAIPDTPRVSAEGLAPALTLFPASRTAPSLAGVPLADFVEADLLGAPSRPSAGPPDTALRSPARWRTAATIAAAVAAFLAAALVMIRRRRPLG